MNTRSLSPSQHSRVPVGRRSLQVVAAASMLIGSLVVAVPSSDAAPTNPFDAAHGFNVITRGDAHLGANETEGPVAIGGNLTFDGYNIAIHDPGTYKVDPDDEFPTSLLVKGSVDFGASAGEVRVLDGWLNIGNSAGATAHQFNNTMVSVNQSATDLNQVPRIVVQGDAQEAATVFRQSTLDIEAIFAGWETLSAGLAECAADVYLSRAGAPDVPWDPSSNDRYPHLAIPDTGRQRVLTLDATQLAGMDSITLDSAPPTASSPLIINVTSVPDPWVVPQVGHEHAHSPYILWNFGDLTEINIEGNTGRPLNGTVLAPSATLTYEANNNMNGGVFVNELVASGATGNEEIHHHPFQGLIEPCEDPYPTTTTESTTTTTEPTTTESTTTSTTEPTTTTTESTTTTTEPTTSTTEPEETTTTTTEPTTSTTEPEETTTTTTEPTTSTTEPEQTTTTTEPEVSPSTTESTTSTTGPEVGPNTSERPSTSAGADVGGADTSRGSSGSGAVAADSLARTGSEASGLASTGVAMLLGGAVLLALVSRPRRSV